jgi:hypothetical protein
MEFYAPLLWNERVAASRCPPPRGLDLSVPRDLFAPLVVIEAGHFINRQIPAAGDLLRDMLGDRPVEGAAEQPG